ncbi:MAG: hypothetical protein GXX95_11775 [Methanomassiliicoccus sp.]|nr:hypothetical protein [Methanomassiliicoccus sp.]
MKQYEILSVEKLKAIHEATMELLQKTGVQVADKSAREIFRKNGCTVNDKTNMVQIPRDLVEKAIKTAPSAFKLHGREKDKAVTFEYDADSRFTNFGIGTKMADYNSNGTYNVRNSTTDDIATITKIVDYAQNFSVNFHSLSATDLAGSRAEHDVHEFQIFLENTTKHTVLADTVPRNIDTYFEMEKAIYGGDEEESRNKHLITLGGAPTSPLEMGVDQCQALIKSAEFGYPFMDMSMAMSGGTSSIHMAGTLVTHNAEVLSALTLLQIMNPGNPVFYASSTTIFDVKRGTAPVGSPELGMISAAVSDLGRYYRIPCLVAGI